MRSFILLLSFFLFSVCECLTGFAACTMSGTYTIGPSGAYPTIASALTALNATGLAGAVVLELQTSYTGEAYPINIGNVPCSSPVNTITIRPQGALTIAGAGVPMFNLDGAKYVIIDGRVGSTGATKALTISSTNISGQAFRFINDATGNTIQYCTIKGVNAGFADGVITFMTTTGSTGNDSNAIKFCDIQDGATTPANCIYSKGSPGMDNDNNIVSDCNISNFYTNSECAGIHLFDNNSSWTISNNRMFQTVARSGTSGFIQMRGLYIRCTGNNFKISGNTIGYSSAAGTGVLSLTSSNAVMFRGMEIWVGTNVPSSIQGNVITAINLGFTGFSFTSEFYGISFPEGSADIGTTAPNIIGAATGNDAITVTCGASGAGAVIHGIVVQSPTPAVVNIANNFVGSLTAGASPSLPASISGITATGSGSFQVTGNTVGSATTPKSIQSASFFSSTSGTASVVGMSIAALGTTPIMATGNTIANLYFEGDPTAVQTNGYVVGISIGSSSLSSGRNVVSGNTIYNLVNRANNTSPFGIISVMGIWGNTLVQTLISGNTIYGLANINTSASSTTVAGIQFRGAKSIIGNTIYDLRNASTGTAITAPPKVVGVYAFDTFVSLAPAIGSDTIANNMISLGNGATTNTSFTGIMNSSTISHKLVVLYNTVNIEGTVASGALHTACFLRGNYSTSTIRPVDIRNNIFVNNRTGGTGKHYAIANALGATASHSGWTGNASNYNVLNASNSANVGYWSGDKTFAAWQSVIWNDVNSYSAVPVTFVNTAIADLHLNTGSAPSFVESRAAVIAGITDDADGNSRPGPAAPVNGGSFAPDLGADEIDGAALEPLIYYTPLVDSCNTSDRTVIATVIAAAGVPSGGSGTEPRIYFKKRANGVWQSRPGTLASGTLSNGVWNFTVVAADMGGLTNSDSVYYYIVAQNNSGTVRANPTSGLVAANVNSVSTPPSGLNYYRMIPPVVGSITGANFVCTGSIITLSDSIAGGVWSSSNTNIATVNSTGIVTGVVAGNTTISYTITTPCGSTVATTTVTVHGAAAAGTVNANAISSCAASFTSTLSATGTSTGITYQWQSSLDSLAWTNVAGATNNTYTATVSTPIIYYRLTVAGACGAGFDTSAGLKLGNGRSYASLPYTESFEPNWAFYCTSDAVPNVYWQNSPTSGNASWRRNDRGGTASWGNTSVGEYTPASSSGTYSARFHSGQTSSTGNLDLFVNMGVPGDKLIMFDYIGINTGNKLAVYLSVDGGVNFSPLDSITGLAINVWSSKHIVVSSTSTACVIRFRAKGSNSGPLDIALDNVRVSVVPSCSGGLTGGSANASDARTCSLPYSPNISALGFSAGTGSVYQWQSSLDSANWTNIPGATNTIYTATVSIPVMYYRLANSCPSGGAVAYSTGIRVGDNKRYAPIPLFESFEGMPIDNCASLDAVNIYWQARPYNGNNSWRRDDLGGSAAWSGIGGGYTPRGSDGMHSQRFYSSFTTGTGSEELYIDLSTPGAKLIQFDYLLGNGKVNIFLSADGGATFSEVDSITVEVDDWSTKHIVTSVTSGSCVLQFRAKGYSAVSPVFVSNDLAIDNVRIGLLPSCTGTPSAGVINTAPYARCTFPQTVHLTSLGYTAGAGITYQWQTSLDSVSWTNIPGATNSLHIASVSLPVIFYRLAATCSGSGLTGYAGIRLGNSRQYATLPFSESFEPDWIGNCSASLSDAPNQYWQTTPFTGNNSWRRDDNGGDAGWISPTSGTYTPAATAGIHSARYHNSTTSVPGNLDLYINMSTPGVKQISFDCIGINALNKLVIQLSTDGGGTFIPLDSVATAVGGWTTKVITTSVTSGSCVLRFRGIGVSGSGTDIGLDNVNVIVQTACSGVPSAGTVVASAVTSCSIPYTSYLSAIGYSAAAGIQYQWQSSRDSVSWSNIPGATTAFYTANVTIPIIYYRFTDTCTFSNVAAYSPGVKLGNSHSYATLPFIEDFEPIWLSWCSGTRDAANKYWQTTPYTGENSWRREDGGTGVWGVTSGTYMPEGSTGSHSARFHSRGTALSGFQDLYIDMNVPGNKPIAFDYIGTTGANKLALYYSTDGGVTFTPLDSVSTATSTWVTRHDTVTTTSASCILRFIGTGTGSGSDIGLDNVRIGIIPPCGGTPVAGTVDATVTSSCTAFTSGLTLNGATTALGIAYQWQSSPDNTVFTPISGATNKFYSANVSASTYYNCIVKCTASGFSATTPAVLLEILTPPAVSPILGTASVCARSAAALSNATPGGAWTSTNTTVATIDNNGAIAGLSAGTTTVSYALTNTCGTTAQAITFTVNPMPDSGIISGPLFVCPSATVTLSNSSPGGVWSSGTTAIATIGATGIVTGVSPGMAPMSYSVTNSCGTTVSTATVTVRTLPDPGTISGLDSVCPAAIITLSDGVPGGVWSSGSSLVATVDASGNLSGVSTGAAVISYSVTNICTTAITTFTVHVKPLPDAGVISGITTICPLAVTALSDNIADGVWSSANTAVATVSASGVVTGIATGTAAISYTITNSCSTSVATATVTVSAMPFAGAINGPSSVCEASAILMTDATPGGIWSSASTAVATVSATGVVSGVAAGSSTISYTVTNGCGFDVATAPVTVDPLPIVPAPISGAATVCASATTTMSSPTPGGAWASINTGVATVDGSGIVTGVTAGTAVISYSTTNGCGTAAVTTTITVTPLPVAGTISGLSDICEGLVLSLTDPVAGGSWSSSVTTVATVSSSGAVSGILAGSAIVSYSVTNGCGAAVATFTVTVNPQPVTPAGITGVTTICAGTTTSLSSTTPGGAWSSSNLPSATVDGAGVVAGTSAGTATISYAYTNSCGSRVTTTLVTINPLPAVAGITGSSNVCVGATAMLSNVTPGGVWSTANASIATVNSTGAVSGVSPGFTNVLYAVTNGCGTTTVALGMTVATVPAVGPITGTTSVCELATTQLNSSLTGGIWNSSNTNVATVSSAGVVTGVLAGTAIISYEVANSCGVALATATVTVDPLPVSGVISGSLSLCAGTSVTLSSTVAGGTWSATPAAVATISASGSLNGVAGGTTMITYSIANGCGVARTTATVTVNPLPDAGTIAGPAVVCVNAHIMLSDAVTGGSWFATNANAVILTTGDVTGVAAGIDTILYAVANTCGADTAIKIISIDPLPEAGIISGQDSVCVGSDITLSSTVAGGLWSSVGTSVSVAGSVARGITPGSDTIIYKVVNGCGVDSVTYPVTVNPIPDTGVISGSHNVCVGAQVSLSNIVTDGAWSAAGTAISITAAGIVTGLATGTDTVRYSVSNACGTWFASWPVTVDPLPDAGVITGGTEVCIGSAVTLSNSVAGGVWSSSSSVLATIDASGMLTGVASGTVTVVYTVTNTALCSNASSHVVTVNVLPDAGTISGPASVCAGALITLTATNAHGIWSSNNTAVATIDPVSALLSALSQGVAVITYAVSAGTTGCTAFTTHSVTVVSDPSFTISGTYTDVTCYGAGTGTITVIAGNGSGTYKYAWSNGDSLSAIQGLVAGSYSVVVTDMLTQCSITDSFVIMQPDSLRAEPHVKDDLCKASNGVIHADIEGGTFPYTYQWSNGAGGNKLEALPAGVYTLVLTDARGCILTQAVTVGEGACPDVIVHNGISPNGDGANDTWEIAGIENYPGNEVQIFDKLGDMVFEQKGYSNNWSGQGRNGPLPAGTYYYVLKLNAGGREPMTGALLLKR